MEKLILEKEEELRVKLEKIDQELARKIEWRDRETREFIKRSNDYLNGLKTEQSLITEFNGGEYNGHTGSEEGEGDGEGRRGPRLVDYEGDDNAVGEDGDGGVLGVEVDLRQVDVEIDGNEPTGASDGGGAPAFEDRGLVSYGYDQDGPEDEGDGGKTGHVHADET